MSETLPAVKRLLELEDERFALLGAMRLAGWDHQVIMPAGGLESRAWMMEEMAGMVHRVEADPRVADWLEEAEAGLGENGDEASLRADLRLWRRRHQQARAIPASLEREQSRTSILAKAAWKAAREADDFPAFAPLLEKQVELARARADCLAPPLLLPDPSRRCAHDHALPPRRLQ